MKAKTAGPAILALFCAAALAGPAPWYRWRSQLDGKLYCAQASPGAGWERAAGPYRDVRCKKSGRPEDHPKWPRPRHVESGPPARIQSP